MTKMCKECFNSVRLANETARPSKILEFGLQSLKILERANVFTFNCKTYNQNELFVLNVRNTFDVIMFENKNGG